MSEAETPTLDADLARLTGILADDAGKGGLSLEHIRDITARTGETWSLRTINALLCELGSGRVSHAKIRTPRGKVTLYTLRGQN